jgi:hypothetical protein
VKIKGKIYFEDIIISFAFSGSRKTPKDDDKIPD